MAVDISKTQTHSHFAEPATTARLEAIARSGANGFATQLVATAEEAKRAVLDLIPLGSEVHTGASASLEALSLHQEFNAAFATTRLPERPDYERANAFLVNARRRALSEELP